MKSSAVVNAAVKGAQWLIGLSVLQKGLSFLCNLLVLQVIQVKVAGVATVQLELFLSTCLFLREGFRLALLRSKGLNDSTAQHDMQQLINISWLTMPFGIVVSAIVYGWMRSQMQESTHLIDGWQYTIYLYVLAVGIEWLVEPLVVMAQSSLFFGWRVTAEATAFTCRTMVHYLCVVHLQMQLVAYGYAQLVYATTLLIVYLCFFIQKVNSSAKQDALHSYQQLLPKSVGNGLPAINPSMLRLGITMTLQSFIKYILTEGGNVVLAFSANYYDMGLYSLAFNLGSMVPRILFLPIEDATKAIFSKLQTNESLYTDEKSVSDKFIKEKRQEAHRILYLLLKAVTYIGLVFACFGAQYTMTLIRLIMGKAKSETEIPAVLGWYCFYIMFLALNGVLEAFVHASASQAQLIKLNGYMVLFFIVYAAAIYVLMHEFNYGSIGLIWANCINMMTRIIYCSSFISDYFQYHKAHEYNSYGIRAALPQLPVLLWFIVSCCIGYISKGIWLATPSFAHHVAHVGVGLVCLIVLCALIYLFDRKFIRQVIDFRRQRQQTAESKHD